MTGVSSEHPRAGESDGLMWKIYGLDIRELMRQGAPEEYLERLPAGRREKLLRMKKDEERYRSLGAGLLIAYGLYREGILPEKQEIGLGAHGKPELFGNSGVHFNVSHAGDYVAAVVADSSVGIDIEKKRSLRPGVIRKCCTEPERRWLEGQEDREAAFLRLWTAKESYVKWSGEGLTCPLDTVETCLCDMENGARQPGIYRNGAREPVRLWEYGGIPDYHICICAGQTGEPGAPGVYGASGGPKDSLWLSAEELRRWSREKGV